MGTVEISRHTCLQCQDVSAPQMYGLGPALAPLAPRDAGDQPSYDLGDTHIPKRIY